MIETKQDLLDEMAQQGACREATDWVNSQTSDPAAELWEACPQADWLLWFAAKRGVDHKVLTLAACDCVRTGLRLVPEGEDRPRIAIETAEAWARGEATVEDVRRARRAAYAAYDAYAAYAAYAANAAYAAYAAYYAAYAAYYAANAAYADAAYAAAHAAYAAHAAHATHAAHAAHATHAAHAERAGGQGLADLVRKRITWERVR